MPTIDNAGVFIQRFDESLVAAQVQPDALFVAASIQAERGFINQPKLITNIPDFRSTYFVNGKDHRKFGKTSHEVEIYLNSANPLWACRAGDPTWEMGGVTVEIPATVPAFAASGVLYVTGDVVVNAGNYFQALQNTAPVASTGDITIAAGNVTDGETITITDSFGAIVYEFDDDASITGDVAVAIGSTAQESMDNLTVAIVNQFTAGSSYIAVLSSTGSIELTNLYDGVSGNVAITEVGVNITVTGMINGADLGAPVNGTVWLQLADEAAAKLLAPQDTTAEGKTQAEVDDFVTDDLAYFFAKGEGDWGNRIGIEIVKSSLTYEGVAENSVSEIRVYFDGSIAPVETHTVTRNPKSVDGSGQSLYFPTVLSRNSKYITASDNKVVANEDLQMHFQKISLLGGTVLTDPLSTNYLTALNKILQFPEVYDIWMALNPGCVIDYPDFSVAVIANENCLGLSPVKEADNAKTSTELLQLRASSYNGSNFLVSGPIPRWVRVTEEESGEKVFIGSTGHKAWDIATQFNNGQLFKAPAGKQRGAIAGVDQLSRVDTGADRVILSSAQLNSIKQDTTGIYFWETLTSQTFASAFSNEHVTLAWIAMIRAINTTLDPFTFEFNDQDTVDQIMVLLDDIGAQLVSQNGLQAFEVHDSNNTIGSETMTIDFVVQFKGIAKKIVVRVTAIPSTSDFSISIAA